MPCWISGWPRLRLSCTPAPTSCVVRLLPFSAAGTYVLQLAASDTELSRTDTITILVNPVVVTSGTYGNGGANWLVPASGTLRLEVEHFDLGGEGVVVEHDHTAVAPNVGLQLTHGGAPAGGSRARRPRRRAPA